jgi:hypothetical protein
VRIPGFIVNFDGIEFDIQELIHRYQRTAYRQVILEFNEDDLADKCLEKRVKQLTLSKLE